MDIQKQICLTINHAKVAFLNLTLLKNLTIQFASQRLLYAFKHNSQLHPTIDFQVKHRFEYIFILPWIYLEYIFCFYRNTLCCCRLILCYLPRYCSVSYWVQLTCCKSLCRYYKTAKEPKNISIWMAVLIIWIQLERIHFYACDTFGQFTRLSLWPYDDRIYQKEPIRPAFLCLTIFSSAHGTGVIE